MRAIVIAALAACAMIGSCTTTPRMSREELAARIGEDAAAFNEAYSKAVNAQILLNVLRSRDRQPRYYLSMTGIQDAPSFLYGDNIGLGGVPFGEQRSQPFGIFSFGARREVTSRPSYAVQPLDAKTLTKAVFQPTPSNVFAHYWESGWPRDMLLLLMVEKISVTRDGKTEEFTNEANDIRDDCGPNIDSRGCAFVRAARGFLDEIGAKQAAGQSLVPESKGVCGLIEAYEPSTPVHEAPSPKDGECAPAFVIGAATYRFDLRSFDDIVYYVGELMRSAYTQAQGKPNEVMEARVYVRVAGLRGGGVGTPLFRIIPASAAQGKAFAASVSYNGETFYAGPPIGRSCADATSDGIRKDDPAHGDRSSSVLSLLAELLALNQSPDAIRAPARLLAE